MTVARTVISLALLIAIASSGCPRQSRAQAAEPNEKAPFGLIAVVVVSRHGVRSPTNPTELSPFVAKAWPGWEVAPGDLTPHGARLMKIFGAAYRKRYASQNLVSAYGCPARNSVYVWADVDERTKATAAALLDGFAPQCGLHAQSLDAANDPLFHAIPQAGTADARLSIDALGGSIGNSPNQIMPSFGAALAELDSVLGCKSASCTSIASIPTTLQASSKTGLPSLAGGVDVASTAVEDLILAYTDGKPMAEFGDASLDARSLLDLSALHVVKSELTTQTPYVARVQGSNLLAHLGATVDALATGQTNAGTRVPADARFVVFVGHDTNLESLAGILRLRWLMAGYQIDDTPPGGALLFEIYGTRGAAATVRTFYTAQSLDQMRMLSTDPPARVPVFVPGCASLDCSLSDFDRAIAAAVDPHFVIPW